MRVGFNLMCNSSISLISRQLNVIDQKVTKIAVVLLSIGIVLTSVLMYYKKISSLKLEKKNNSKAAKIAGKTLNNKNEKAKVETSSKSTKADKVVKDEKKEKVEEKKAAKSTKVDKVVKDKKKEKVEEKKAVKSTKVDKVVKDEKKEKVEEKEAVKSTKADKKRIENQKKNERFEDLSDVEVADSDDMVEGSSDTEVEKPSELAQPDSLVVNKDWKLLRKQLTNKEFITEIVGGEEVYSALPQLDLSDLKNGSRLKIGDLDQLNLDDISAPLMRGISGKKDTEYLIIKYHVNDQFREGGFVLAWKKEPIFKAQPRPNQIFLGNDEPKKMEGYILLSGNQTLEKTIEILVQNGTFSCQWQALHDFITTKSLRLGGRVFSL